MAKAKQKAPRREDSLSRERIVDAAIDLLDEVGAEGLTFRELASRLSTGAGAIYWHVDGKDTLLAAATDAIVTRAISELGALGAARVAIRKIGVCVFDVIDAHPWVSAELARGPWGSAALQIFEQLGRQLEKLGVREKVRFTAASTLVGYVIGVSSQNAANARLFDPPVDRTTVLALEAKRWKNLDADAYPFTRSVASALETHDDRAEFVAGIDLVLGGIAASI